MCFFVPSPRLCLPPVYLELSVERLFSASYLSGGTGGSGGIVVNIAFTNSNLVGMVRTRLAAVHRFFPSNSLNFLWGNCE